MASLVDTNALVCRFDPRDPVRQRIATRLLESGIPGQSLVVAHQSAVEFVAAVTPPPRNLRGAATDSRPWFDAHLWACAEVTGLPEILSEDDQHGGHYGSVRAVNPFLSARTGVHELPALQEARRAAAEAPAGSVLMSSRAILALQRTANRGRSPA